MEKKPGFNARLDAFFAGKGFYIVLFLCVAVIGVSAWVMFGGNETTVDSGTGVEVQASGGIEYETAPVILEPPATDNLNENEIIALEPEQGGAEEANGLDEEPSEPAAAEEDAPAVPVAAEAPTYVWPLYGEIERPYCVDALMYDKTMRDWRVHSGIDIAADIGVQVVAAGPGRVENVYEDSLLGMTVVIDHGGGLRSIYSNLAGTPTVYTGDGITAGAVIGAVGNTALGETGEVTHLHLSMTLDGRPVNPADYLP